MAGEQGWPRGPLGATVDVHPDLCNTRGLLFGGWGAGLMAAAAAHGTGGHVLDLSVSFPRPVPAGRRLTVDRRLLAAGRNLTHCSVTATMDSEPVLAGLAVVGPLGEPDDTRPAPVGVPPPADCPRRDYPPGPHAGIGALVEVRVAEVTAGSVLLWGRLLCDVPPEVRLAVLSDHVPYMLRKSLPGLAPSSTVSASLRVLSARPAEWDLLGVTMVAHSDRTAVGRVEMWAGGVTLAGVAEQTTRLIKSASKDPGPGE